MQFLALRAAASVNDVSEQSSHDTDSLIDVMRSLAISLGNTRYSRRELSVMCRPNYAATPAEGHNAHCIASVGLSVRFSVLVCVCDSVLCRTVTLQ